ncbi:MAG: serine/threonine-protein kinase [Planctomycetaceae bacterium]
MNKSPGSSDDTSPASDIAKRQSSFDAFLRQGSIGWQTARPFLKVLGAGGQGTVVLAERRGAGSFRLPVALKFFSPKRFRTVQEYDAEMLRLTEVSSMAARIQDDHLVDVHTFIRDQGIYYMEMEWVDGFDLLHILRRDTLNIVQESVTESRWASINERIVTSGEVDCRLKPGMAIAILRECLGGVSALHREGIIHCDLKPSNVMVKRSGQVKIIDIGSAFWEGRPPEGQPCTLEYAAPEVLAGYRATPQSDLASLGYMLVEMLTGSKPFAGLKYSELMAAKNTLLDRLPGMLPVDEFAFSELLIVLLRRLLHPDPAKRFPTAEDAELSDEGAAGFLRELVKSDLANEYVSELRQWLAEMETEAMQASQAACHPTGSTTRLMNVRPGKTETLTAIVNSGRDVSDGFRLDLGR